MGTRKLSFKLKDRIGETEVSPEAVPLPWLKQFADEVGKFLRGSKREVSIEALPVALVKGSLKIDAAELSDNLEIWGDLEKLAQEGQLQAIDPIRAAIVKQWQDDVHKRPTRSYAMRPDDNSPIVVSSTSAFCDSGKSRWVRAERYLHGSLYESGGKESPNIHLQRADGKTLLIKANREQLRDEKVNRLYHDVLVRVVVDENLDTGDLRNASLIGFEDYRPAFDPAALAAFVEEGREAWRDVNDPAAWVRAQRGG